MNYLNFEIINYYFFARNTSVARLIGRTLNPPLYLSKDKNIHLRYFVVAKACLLKFKTNLGLNIILLE